MCGPNSPHRLKLAGFMFTTIGFGIAALDCLCFPVCVCACAGVHVCVKYQECKANPSLSSAYHIRMHDSCNCFKSIVVNSVNHVFLKSSRRPWSPEEKWTDLNGTISGSLHLTNHISAFQLHVWPGSAPERRKKWNIKSPIICLATVGMGNRHMTAW